MSRDGGYLRTLSCSISLSSCRVRAESIARALNSRLWPRTGLTDTRRDDTYDRLLNEPNTSCAAMTNIVDKPPRNHETFRAGETAEIGHIWINELSIDEDENFGTPPCSSPPSPSENEVIVNPPYNNSPLPFCTKFLRELNVSDECRPNENGRNHSIFSEEAKLRDKLQQYADGLLLADEGLETFYDASDDDRKNESFDSAKNAGIENQNVLADHTELVADENCEIVNGIPDSTTALDEETPPRKDSLTSECPTVTLFTVEGCLTLVDDLDDTGAGPHPDFRCSVVDRRVLEVQELEPEPRPRLLRSTSLKTGKTPPGTPGRKKIVRFADVLGLDLEAVRHIVCDDLPTVPSSAFSDLNLPPEKVERSSPPRKTVTVARSAWSPTPTPSGSALSSLFPMFRAPGGDPDFLDRVRRQHVCLETVNVLVQSVHSVCRVLNVSYEKNVVVRYSTDDWRTWEEVAAAYVPFSSDGEFDKFAFSLFLHPGGGHSKRGLSFAIRYIVFGTEHWDSNGGQNYTFQNHSNEENEALLLPTAEAGLSWLHHFL